MTRNPQIIKGTIPALSLHQPYATFIACDEKRFETRDWTTTYRGPMVIQAAKLWAKDQEEFCRTDEARVALRRHGYGFGSGSMGMPLGALVCLAELVEVIKTDDPSPATLQGAEFERKFGHWKPGGFAWRLTNVRWFAKPVPYRGERGWFIVPEKIVNEALG